MGAAGSSIKNYQVGQPYILSTDSTLKITVSPATNVEDGQKYTVFQFPKQDGHLSEPGEKYIEVLKTTRHPYVLKYLALYSTHNHENLVTEHVVPLDVAVEKQEKEEICAGLHNILEALLFLHERSLICHNCVCVSSIFVSDNGEWKLGSFENSTKVLRISKQSYNNDITGYAEFALSVLEYLKDDSETTRNFMAKLEEEFSAESKEIHTLRSLLADPFFKFPYLEALDGIQKLTLKSNVEKIELFTDLYEMLHGLSPYVVCRRFIPILFSQFVITEPIADEYFLQHLFSSGNDYCIENNILPLFDEEHFIKFSMPHILSLYESRDITVRLIIMKFLPLYVECIDKEILQKEILPELLIGLKDSSDVLVRETFLALANIIPILGGKVVVGGESETYFHDRKPDFSRSGDTSGKGLSASATVLDVLSSGKASCKVSNADKNVAEEREQKRLERERLREEQRKKREERRKEREFAKQKKKKSPSSNGSIDSSEGIHPQSSSQGTGRILEDSVDDELNNGNSSEAEWEGFEVLSNGDDMEAKEIVSPVTGYKSEETWSDNRVEVLPSPSQSIADSTTQKTQLLKSKKLANSKRQSLGKESNKGLLDFINSKIVPPMNSEGNDAVSSENLHHTSKTKSTSSTRSSERTLDSKEEPSKSIKPKTMSLSNVVKKKSNVSQGSGDENKSNDISKTNDIKKKLHSLGNEFDIKVSKNKFTTEPDYFADMEPSMEYKKIAPVYVERNADLSSKFKVDLTVEESTGWDDDGWGNDEEVLIP